MKNFSENIKLAIIVPCLNEQEILTHTQTALSTIILKLINQNIISIDSKIIYIDDGSEDGTWNLIEDMLSNNEIICGIKLTKNYGHQNALYAALISDTGSFRYGSTHPDCHIMAANLLSTGVEPYEIYKSIKRLFYFKSNFWSIYTCKKMHVSRNLNIKSNFIT